MSRIWIVSTGLVNASMLIKFLHPEDIFQQKKRWETEVKELGAPDSDKFAKAIKKKNYKWMEHQIEAGVNTHNCFSDDFLTNEVQLPLGMAIETGDTRMFDAFGAVLTPDCVSCRYNFDVAIQCERDCTDVLTDFIFTVLNGSSGQKLLTRALTHYPEIRQDWIAPARVSSL